MNIKIESVPIDRNPKILGGTPVFSGTRVPVRILLEHLEAGDRIDDFLNDFPTVSRDQVVAVLEYSGQSRARDTVKASAARIGDSIDNDLDTTEAIPPAG